MKNFICKVAIVIVLFSVFASYTYVSYTAGHNCGYEDGHKDGFEDGFEDGYDDGYKDGTKVISYIAD